MSGSGCGCVGVLGGKIAICPGFSLCNKNKLWRGSLGEKYLEPGISKGETPKKEAPHSAATNECTASDPRPFSVGRKPDIGDAVISFFRYQDSQ